MISARTLAARERIEHFGTAGEVRSATGAAERWAWWRSAYFDGRDPAWNHWLDTWTGGGDGLSVVEIDDEVIPGETSQDTWYDHLEQVRQASAGALAGSPGQEPPLSAILAVIRPFLDHADERFRDALATCGLTRAEQDLFHAGAMTWLSSRLRATAAPSASVAANIFRLGDASSESDAEERARRFETLVRRWPSRQSALRATPVLDRLLAQISMDAMAACVECAQRYAADRHLLTQEFGNSAEDLQGVTFGLGDPHRRSRTVAHFRFNQSRDLIYKPRSMGADLAFNHLVEWLSGYLSDVPEPVRTLGRGEYGWARFVEASDCADDREVARAYRRTGILLAAFDLCAGSDLHFENIIYERVNPVIVDLETLLSPTVIQQDEAATLFYKARIESILRTGYLPGGAVIGGFRRDFSASALHTTLETPFQEQVYHDDDGDALAVRLKPFLMQPRENCATVEGRRIPVAEHVRALTDGMQEACRVFADRAEELVGADGPLQAFAAIEVRWVPRGTTVYGQALRSSLHPAHMRDGIDHELAWSELAIWGPGGRKRTDILQAEIADLWRCDIPIFTTTANSTHARSSDGVELPDVFLESGWNALLRRVDQLRHSATDRSARAATCAFESVESRGRPHPDNPTGPGDALGPEIFLEEADRIGQRLLDDSFEVDDHLFWVTPRSLSKTDYAASVTDFDLYQGGGGIGLFLHELGLATGDSRYIAAAEACRSLVRFCSDAASHRAGAFNGLAGLIYAEMRLAGGARNIDVAWTRQAVSRLAKAVENDQTLDVIGGAAGAILVLRHLTPHSRLGDEACALIRTCASRLSEAAVHDGDDAFWSSPGLAAPSGGFAHGTAGYAAALAVAADCLESDEWDELARRALGYSTRSGHGGSWCHGDIGRLTAVDLVQRHRPILLDGLDSEIGSWRQAREDSLSGGNDSLCHGVLGNLDGLVGGSGVDRALGLRAASNALRRGRTTGWLPSVANLNPGLMLGHAGIGYQLLRTRDPLIGSILSLDVSQ